MLAKILISPLLETRVGEAEKILLGFGVAKNHPDVLWFEDNEKLGVEQSKIIREHLNFKPYSAKNRVVVLESAQKITDEAQNSLLKTLEEPPENAILILCSDSEDVFLPTILSRCQVVILPTVIPAKACLAGRQAGIHFKNDPRLREDDTKYTDDITQLIKSSVEQRFEYIETQKDREDFLQALIIFFQNQLESHPGGGMLEFGKDLLQAEEWVKSNGNIRAALEYLMLKMPMTS
ncbi:hypothetical protein HYW46_07395 [Candidatus Daviesbacteria bacterium]|nr:hypothetical protein [Candidatus Daviesbacteria bacterium]